MGVIPPKWVMFEKESLCPCFPMTTEERFHGNKSETKEPSNRERETSDQGLPKQKKVDTFIYIIRPGVVYSSLEMVRFRRSNSFCEGLW